jgi:hypothetical protein
MEPDDPTRRYIHPDEKPGEDELVADAEEPEGVIIGGGVGGPPGVAIGEALEGRDPPATDDETTEDETAAQREKNAEREKNVGGGR